MLSKTLTLKHAATVFFIFVHLKFSTYDNLFWSSGPSILLVVPMNSSCLLLTVYLMFADLTEINKGTGFKNLYPLP